jgi:hypothetical protein
MPIFIFRQRARYNLEYDPLPQALDPSKSNGRILAKSGTGILVRFILNINMHKLRGQPEALSKDGHRDK